MENKDSKLTKISEENECQITCFGNTLQITGIKTKDAQKQIFSLLNCFTEEIDVSQSKITFLFNEKCKEFGEIKKKYPTVTFSSTKKGLINLKSAGDLKEPMNELFDLVSR